MAVDDPRLPDWVRQTCDPAGHDRSGFVPAIPVVEGLTRHRPAYVTFTACAWISILIGVSLTVADAQAVSGLGIDHVARVVLGDVALVASTALAFKIGAMHMVRYKHRPSDTDPARSSRPEPNVGRSARWPTTVRTQPSQRRGLGS